MSRFRKKTNKIKMANRANKIKKAERLEKAKQKQKNRIELLIFPLLLILIILSSIMIIRIMHNKPVFQIGESYYNIRIAQAIKQNLFISKDPVQGTFYEPNPYHYLLALLFIIFPIELVSLFTPLLLGVVSALLFFQLLVLIRVRPEQAALSLIILSVTPAFIILFTGLYLSSFVIFLSLLVLLLSLHNKLHNKPVHQLLSILLLIILALTSLTGFLITLIIMFFLFLILKRNLKALPLFLIIPTLLILFLSLLSDFTPRLLGFQSFAFKNILSLLRADLGFDLFLVVLFLTGFIIVWANEKEKKLFNLLVLASFILSFFNIIARAFASFIITVYCVVAIIHFYKRKWVLKIIKTGTLLLVLCSLLFSVMNQANLIVNAQPDQNMLITLIFLKDLGDGRVLTTEKNGFLVDFYSEKKVLLDSNSFLLRDYSELKNASNTLFRSARLKQAETILREHNIRYILITPEMKEELWGNKEQGLWFLVRHSESFVKRYEQEGIELWEYNGLNKYNA